MKLSEETIQILLEWATALKSGNYTQVRHTLKSDDCLCAQGVFLDYIGCEWRNTYFFDPIFNLCVFEEQYLQDVNYSALFGLTASDEEFTSFICEIAILNDVYDKSFHEIADFIEVACKKGELP